MTEIVMNWPWFDRLIIGAFLVTAIFTPYTLSKQLDHLAKQNERIITLLAEIRRTQRH